MATSFSDGGSRKCFPHVNKIVVSMFYPRVSANLKLGDTGHSSIKEGAPGGSMSEVAGSSNSYTKMEVWAHKTSSTPPLFIEVPVQCTKI
jgi:hypothetical protein